MSEREQWRCDGWNRCCENMIDAEIQILLAGMALCEDCVDRFCRAARTAKLSVPIVYQALAGKGWTK